MQIIDYKGQMGKLYRPSAEGVDLVDVPKMNFVMIDGQGDPNTAPEYRDAVEALFTISYTLKMQIKKSDSLDYAVMPLEGCRRS